MHIAAVPVPLGAGSTCAGEMLPDVPIHLIALTNATAFRPLLGIVLLAPLPLGSYRPWAWSVLAVAVGLLLLAWGAGVYAGTARAPVPLSRVAVAAFLLGLVPVWAYAQTSGAMPSALWHPLWDESAKALGRPVAAGISVDHEMTRTAVLRLVTYAGVFLLALQLGRERTRARLAVSAVAVAGTVYAAYGLVVYFAGWERILWLEKWAYEGDLTSTFVNRNAYGAYAGLGVLCSLALFIHGMRPRRRRDGRGAKDVAETLLFRVLPYLVAGVVLGCALLLSHSRGAFLSTGVGVLVLLAAAATARILALRTALVVAVLLGAVALGVVATSGEETMQRLVDTPGAVDARTELFRLTTGAITDAPWTGHGFGTFLSAFRIYRDSGLASALTWEFAHNVHLEMAMDLGLPVTLAAYGAMAILVGTCVGGLLRRRRDQIYPALAIAGVMLIGTHGLVDFSAQIPAIAVTLALLLGVGVAQSWSTDHRAKT